VFDEERVDDRRFETRRERAEAEEVQDVLDREIRFDPDLWVVELEIDDVGDLLFVVPK
jgi:hypothetical protein